MEEETKIRRETESRLLEKVGEVITAIQAAKHVDQVIRALHSLAVLLFPLGSSLLSGSIDQPYRDQVLSVKAPSEKERSDSLQAFYQGAAFPALARVLLFDVASNWLACFPFSAQKHVYDVFFVNGVVNEVIQVLVPGPQQNRISGLNIDAVQANIERLLVLCLLENNGVIQMARKFGYLCKPRCVPDKKLREDVSRVAQIVTSVPDKARLTATPSLSSHSFFKQIILQLLSGVEAVTMSTKNEMDGTFLFIGETFSRICRRGSSDVLLREVTPQILRHIQSCLLSSNGSVSTDLIESNPGSHFWLKLMEVIVDPYAVERISEQLLNQLVAEDASDVEAYWTLWLLFNRLLRHQTAVRSIFLDKYLLWKVFPVSCLRWILQFAVLECPPTTNVQTESHVTDSLLDTVQRLAAVWSKREFVQSVSVEQQAYVTAGIGLCLEKMSKEELDKTKDVMHSILQGVSFRLESPAHLVRKMASSIALAFSKVIDPKNPLFLDEASCNEEYIDWEFGLTAPKKGTLSISNRMEKHTDEIKTSITSELAKNSKYETNNRVNDNEKCISKKLSVYELVDPDEIIDPAMLTCESVSDGNGEDNASENSDSSSDSSLQPYDLTDDDTDLRRNLSQLVDVIGALRKSDDADGVERALDVAESLIRASPDELTHVASDLVQTLVQIRCSDLAAEGEEESADGKRQGALVALIVTCPFQSLDTLNKLLYSANVDLSQRIMILDVMTEAAQELAHTKTMKPKHQTGVLISTISEPQPWFLPSNAGLPGAGSWKEISGSGTPLKWSKSYERELPLKPSQIKIGKTRRWSLRSQNAQSHINWSQNKFPVYAAAFMLPAMQGFDKKRHGVDLLDRDFIVLGKLIYMLGVCMKCVSMHPEASALAPPLLDMLRVREICHHKEAYVRRAVLFAASCVLLALHPSYVASALIEGNVEISKGLEWIRLWALEVADSETDRECYTMAMSCLQLHAEMALQASRALESAESSSSAKSVGLKSSLSRATIKIPYSNVQY
ncbi:hypothetical protein SLA2020_047330 [Shorea laevis]